MMRNGESTTFKTDSIDRGHDGGHTTVPVRKYVGGSGGGGGGGRNGGTDVCASR